MQGENTLSLVNTTGDSLDFRIRDVKIWPEKTNYSQGVVLPNTTKIEIRPAQGYNNYYLSVDRKDFTLYSRPGASDTITIGRSEDGRLELLFTGTNQKINEFLSIKAKYFRTHNADRKGRSQFMLDGKKSYAQILSFNDSLTEVNRDFMELYKTLIPEWYVDYENARLNYLNAWYKVNSVIYRKKSLKSEESIPSDFFDNVYQGAVLQDPKMLGNREYMDFLKQYVTYTFEFIEQSAPQNLDGNELFTKRMEIIDLKFEGIVKEAYMSREISWSIIRGVVYDTTWLDRVEDSQFISFIKALRS